MIISMEKYVGKKKISKYVGFMNLVVHSDTSESATIASIHCIFINKRCNNWTYNIFHTYQWIC